MFKSHQVLEKEDETWSTVNVFENYNTFSICEVKNFTTAAEAQELADELNEEEQ